MWLDENKVEYRFHDFRIDGLTESQVQYFINKLSWERLLNKSSTSWRQLSPEQQADLTEVKAKQLILRMPTLIKRPLLDAGNSVLVGFKSDVYEATLK